MNFNGFVLLILIVPYWICGEFENRWTKRSKIPPLKYRDLLIPVLKWKRTSYRATKFNSSAPLIQNPFNNVKNRNFEERILLASILPHSLVKSLNPHQFRNSKCPIPRWVPFSLTNPIIERKKTPSTITKFNSPVALIQYTASLKPITTPKNPHIYTKFHRQNQQTQNKCPRKRSKHTNFERERREKFWKP